MTAIKISVVLPVYNEEGNLLELYERIQKVILEKLGIADYEIIFVDDRSRDDSWKIIEGLHARDSRVTGIRFSRNFGHHIALSAGLNLSRGDAVIIMDSDLQDLPEEIPCLYEKFCEGYDVVYGIRKRKKFGILKVMTSALFNKMLKFFVDQGLEINTNIFRIASRRVVDVFNKFNEQERFVIGLIGYCGFRQTGVEVEHGTRFAGRTSYSFDKMIRLAWCSITAFSIKPLQLATILGFTLSGVSFLVILFLFYNKIVLGLGVSGWTSLSVTIILLGGIQLIVLGIIGEYIGRIFIEVKDRPLYIVDKTLVPDRSEINR